MNRYIGEYILMIITLTVRIFYGRKYTSVEFRLIIEFLMSIDLFFVSFISYNFDINENIIFTLLSHYGELKIAKLG